MQSFRTSTSLLHRMKDVPSSSANVFVNLSMDLWAMLLPDLTSIGEILFPRSMRKSTSMSHLFIPVS